MRKMTAGCLYIALSFLVVASVSALHYSRQPDVSSDIRAPADADVSTVGAWFFYGVSEVSFSARERRGSEIGAQEIRAQLLAKGVKPCREQEAVWQGMAEPDGSAHPLHRRVEFFASENQDRLVTMVLEERCQEAERLCDHDYFIVDSRKRWWFFRWRDALESVCFDGTGP